MKYPNLKTGEFFYIEETSGLGIYKGVGKLPYFSGLLKNGEPFAYGPGLWSGRWFLRKKEALSYLQREEERW